MKRFLFSLLGLLFVFAANAHIYMDGYDTKNNFTEDEYELAIAKSKLENKLVFIDFHAKWCTPCKWMEKTTLQDVSVKKVLDEKYVTIKVDIDDFDGFDLKQQYEVQILPTMIFLNTDGKMLERVTETMGATKFLAMIKAQSVNVTPIVHPSNTSPFVKKETVVMQQSTEVSTTTTTATTTTATATSPSVHSSPKEHLNTNGQYKKSYADKSNSKDVTKGIRKYLSLQMGVFESMVNAKEKEEYLRSVSNMPVVISHETSSDGNIYKVYLGEFHSLEAAKRYKYKLLRKYSIKSIIK